jgi:hypothetical protein
MTHNFEMEVHPIAPTQDSIAKKQQSPDTFGGITGRTGAATQRSKNTTEFSAPTGHTIEYTSPNYQFDR